MRVVLRMAPDGSLSVLLDDGDPEVITRVERNFARQRLTLADRRG